MRASVKAFKSLISKFNKFKKNVIGGQVNFDTNYSKVNHDLPDPYVNAYDIHYSSLVIKGLAAAHNITKSMPIPGSGLQLPAITGTAASAQGKEVYEILKSSNGPNATDKKSIVKKLKNGEMSERLAKEHKSMRFIPKTTPEEISNPYIIDKAPIELMEGNHTYRILVDSSDRFSSSIYYIGRDDDDIYDYLDRGFFLQSIDSVNKVTDSTDRYVICTNQLDVHTMHIFALCQIQPNLVSNLVKKCFVHSSNAEMVRLKMEKKLTPKSRKTYEEIRCFLEKDYQTNTSLMVINSVISGNIPRASISGISISSRVAEYENIKIEADDLLSVISEKINFGGEFDIYEIVQVYAAHIQTISDGGERNVIPTFHVNGIPIEVTVSETGVRRINGKRINKIEVQEIIYRASCHHAAEEYALMLNRVSKMSLRWHDAITNGLPVKIHSMNYEEYSMAKPSSAAPVIKLYIDPEEKCIKLRTGENTGARIKLGGLIANVDTINRKTNDRYSSAIYKSRDYRWAREELAKAIIKNCRFEKNVKNEDGTVTNTVITTVTKEDISALIKVADEVKTKAIERSKEFLKKAVELTKAEKIEFNGSPAYKVKGALREYAIVIETAKVYDFETKQYRCIVNDNHFRGAGYDDIAARLYVLKNDSMMQSKIGTLAGSAQPQYENHHAYQPERSVDDIIDKLDLV